MLQDSRLSEKSRVTLNRKNGQGLTIGQETVGEALGRMANFSINIPKKLQEA